MRRSSLRWTIPLFLALQVALLWIQGAQIHRQNELLVGLREDIQSLADALDAGNSSDDGMDESQTVPSAFQTPPSSSDKRDKDAMAVLGAQEEQDATAAKELQASRESAKKAVSEAREAQSKLSITENIKKAEETKKVQKATQQWQWLSWAALGLVLATFLGRSYLRRRG